MSDKLNIYEKVGDFILNIIQLVVGGIIFAAVMADKSVKGLILYIIAISFVIVAFVIAMLFFKIANKNNSKQKEG